MQCIKYVAENLLHLIIMLYICYINNLNKDKMETSKQKAIREAYRENYQKVKNYIDENGWFKMDYDINDSFANQFTSCCFQNYEKNLPYGIRPKSLQGIETNNGWIKIEIEADLPNQDGSYFTITTYCNKIVERDYPIFLNTMTLDEEKEWWLKYVTHYQPIIKPQPPIY